MMIFTPDTTEAHRWWKNGDHPLDEPEIVEGVVTEGKFVKRYLSPDQPGAALHTVCGSPWNGHGQIEDIVVCPGDWIVRGADDLYRVVRQSIFGTEDGVEAVDGYTSYADCRHPEHERTAHDSYAEAEMAGAQHGVETGHAVDVYAVTRG